MAAINFDQPSEGHVNSSGPALNITNTHGVGLQVTNANNSGIAVVAINNADPSQPILGKGIGVLGRSNSGGDGVRGETNSNNDGLGGGTLGAGAVGAVVGISSKLAPGGWFESTSGDGVRGITHSDDHAAIVGVSGGLAPAGIFYGNVRVLRDMNIDGSVLIDGPTHISNSTHISGPTHISSDLHVSGNITKGGGGFKIDHPLDPASKYLNHGLVESEDMKNIYDGVAILDENGEVTVKLPEWFEAVNQEFRYQITAIGAPSPNLYIKHEISNNRFSIAGGPKI